MTDCVANVRPRERCGENIHVWGRVGVLLLEVRRYTRLVLTSCGLPLAALLLGARLAWGGVGRRKPCQGGVGCESLGLLVHVARL